MDVSDSDEAINRPVLPTDRSALVWFYLLAFTISWIGWVPQALHSRGLIAFSHPVLSFLGGAGPTLAAVLVIWWQHGRGSLPSLFQPLFDWRQRWVWYAVVLLFWPVAAGLALGLMAILGVQLQLLGPFAWGTLLPIFLMMLLSNVWEEIGWRGFALPAFQRHYGDLAIAVIMGLLWSLWHLPLMFDPASPMASYPWLAELLFSLAQTVIYIWLFNQTNGSLLFVSFFHAAANTVAFLLLDFEALLPSYPYVVAVTTVVAIMIIIRYGSRRFGGSTPVAN